ncbi:MAG TPA: HD domain-containing protein [Candidatus Eremiobacteraceae bacterium]|nr:HD domain-containing protein [Candidatus Eremiobacteraceae bacterium]
MKRSDFVRLSAISAIGGASSVTAATPERTALPRSVAGIAIPDSYIARQATSEAHEVESAHVFRHSVRSFLFAELISRARKIKHDVETVYVSCVLHDIGLSEQHSTPHTRFEVDGANAAKKLLETVEAKSDRIRIVWDAIALHAMYDIARYKDPEVKLVSAGVITDVGAAFVSSLVKPDVQKVLDAFPHRGFNDAFLKVLIDYARRKPDAVGDSFIEGVAIRTVPGYKPSNFYDAMKAGDAFSQLGFS